MAEMVSLLTPIVNASARKARPEPAAQSAAQAAGNVDIHRQFVDISKPLHGTTVQRRSARTAGKLLRDNTLPAP